MFWVGRFVEEHYAWHLIVGFRVFGSLARAYG
jgi:hypothetical protein